MPISFCRYGVNHAPGSNMLIQQPGPFRSWGQRMSSVQRMVRQENGPRVLKDLTSLHWSCEHIWRRLVITWKTTGLRAGTLAERSRLPAQVFSFGTAFVWYIASPESEHK